jgi:hypothetical protein
MFDVRGLEPSNPHQGPAFWSVIMRAIAAVAATAIAGGTLTIAYTAIEVTAATVGASIPDGIRTIAATVIGLTVLGPLGLAILCRQRTIIDTLADIRTLLLTLDRGQARRDYEEITRRLDDSDNVTRMYPKD